MLKSYAVGSICVTSEEVEGAIQELQKVGLGLRKISIIGREHYLKGQFIDSYRRHQGMVYSGLMIGEVLIVGPLVSSINEVLEGVITLRGLSTFEAGLYSLGISKDDILQYETALKNNKFVVIAHGSAHEADTAKLILHQKELAA